MKKNMVEEACKHIITIPSVTTNGVTVSPAIFIAAYYEYNHVIEQLSIIMFNKETAEMWYKKAQNLRKKGEKMEAAECEDAAEYHEEKAEEALNEIKQYIEHRKSQNWE